jgi:protein-disulfide isomerase
MRLRSRPTLALTLGAVGAVLMCAALINPRYAGAMTASAPARPLQARSPVPSALVPAVAQVDNPAPPVAPASAGKPRGLGATRVKLRPTGGYQLEVFGLVFFLMVTVLASSAGTLPDRRDRHGLYLFWLSIVGVAGVLWALNQVSYRWTLVGVDHVLAIGCVLILFVASARAPRIGWRNVLRRFVPDVGYLATRRSTVVSALIVSAVLLTMPDPAARGRPPFPDGEEFAQWFTTQPRTLTTLTSSVGKVQLVLFNDYQCPACKAAMLEHHSVIVRLQREHPGMIQLVERDYPIERECNPFANRDLHHAACEAAVAVRLASAHGRGREMANWLWENQARLTRETVLEAGSRMGLPIGDADAYAQTLEQVVADVRAGHELAVEGTPTYFLNGVRLQWVPAKQFEWALRYEIKRIANGALTTGTTGGQHQGR